MPDLTAAAEELRQIAHRLERCDVKTKNLTQRLFAVIDNADWANVDRWVGMPVVNTCKKHIPGYHCLTCGHGKPEAPPYDTSLDRWVSLSDGKPVRT